MRGISQNLRTAWATHGLVGALRRSRIGVRAALILAITLGGIASASAQTFTLTIQPNTLPPATQGVAYNNAVTAVGGNSNYSLAVTSGSLPAGLSLTGGSGTWAITGTPTGNGSASFTISATDIDGNTGFRPYTFTTGTAGGMSINPGSLPNGFVGTAYNQTVSGSGGTSPYSFTFTGTLPTGLSLSSGGTLSGTPSAGGSFTFTVHGSDSGGNTGQRTYTVNIGANILTVSPASLPPGSVGSSYTQTVTASGGDGGPYTFALTSGAMPTGTSIASNGNITGTPSAGGSYTFTIRATDGSANIGNRTYTVNIGSNILTVTPATQPNGTVGVAYSQNFGATGGTGGPYTFARTSGTLPTGLSLSSGGTLSGTPTASGPFTFDVTATDGNFNTGTRSYTVTINLAPLTINPSSLPAATVGTPYSSGVTASGGSGNYSYTILSGSLPNGLSIAPGTGAITGTPTTSGPFNFTIQATDNTTPNTGSRAYTINVGTAGSLTLAPTTLPNGTNGTGYSQTITASGATGTVTYVLASGTLPAGLTISSGGVISGTPSGSGSSSFTIMGTDSVGNTGSQAYTVNIGTNALTVGPATIAAGTRTLPYSQQMTATGGTGGPYTFTISAGSLPAGLTMNSSGLISGTPTGAGSTFTVRALDAQGNFGTHAYTMIIGTVSLVVNPPTLPRSVVGRPFSATILASGGNAPYTFTISGGALPPGLTLSSGGVISGTPTSAGTASFTVQALDSTGNVGSRAYTMNNRADPALDPEVQGLILAQVASAQRLASAQVSNITRHLETLHENFNPCGFNFNIAVPISGAAPQQFGAPYNPSYGPRYADPNALYSPNGQYGAPQQGYGPQGYPSQGYAQSPARKPAGPFNSAADPVTTSADPSFAPQPQYQQAYPQSSAKRLPPCSSDWMTSMAFWTSGSFQFGSVTPSGAPSGNRFNTAGLTAGVDLRPSDSLIVGIAIGYGGDRTDVGLNGSRSDSTSLSAALYACMRLISPFFLDAAIGYGSLGYDNRRFVTADSTFADGSRKGSYWYGALKLSAELVRGNVKIAPYISGDFTSVSLGSYSEQGPSSQLLSYNEMNFNALSGAVGLRGSIDLPMSFGILSPNARVEYKQTSQSAFDQSMYYTDLGAGSSSTFGQPVGARSMITGALGLRARSAGGLGVEIEYAASVGTDSYQSQSIRGAMRVPF